MIQKRQRLLGAALALASLAATGCESYLEVENPGVIEANTIDAVQDAETFSLSAQTDFFDAFDDVVVYGGFFTGEIHVDDTFPTRNDIARRQMDDRNGTLNSEVWRPLASALASNERVQKLLAGSPKEKSISTARAALNSGYALVLMAETFCQGVISVSPEELGRPLTPQQTLDEAIKRFQKAIEVGTTAKATSIVQAAQVGLARAHLAKGAYREAISAAQNVPAGFEYVALKVDDPSNRGRLGNTVVSFTLARPNVVVPSYFRALNDPRVGSKLATDSKGNALQGQGGNLDFYAQTKYSSYGAPLRLASGLEARYIVAEAELKLGNPAPALALIAARKVDGTEEGDDFATGNPVLVELLDQKARDFFLEGQHLGSFRRNPKETPYVLPAGTKYYNPSVGGNVGTQTCFLIPEAEKSNNPNFPKS